MTDHQTVQYYRDRAREYEAIYHRDDPVRQQELADEADRLRTLAKGRRVLEFACGSGWWTRIMSETAESIVAVDLSKEMLEIAASKAFGCPVDLIESDMTLHHAPPAGFGLIALGFWFSHQPRENYDDFFEMIRRPLAPDGRIWMIDNNPFEDDPLHAHTRYDQYGNNFKKRRLNDGREYEILKNYFTEQELRGCFVPRFNLDRLTFGTYYWSVVLRCNCR